MGTPTIRFTRDMLVRFKVRYAKAVEAGEVQFVFEGNTFLTGYAKYLIEYLNQQFGIKDDR